MLWELSFSESKRVVAVKPLYACTKTAAMSVEAVPTSVNIKAVLR
jgi:hypothetical protein